MVALLVLGATAAFWFTVVHRWRAGRPVLPYEPRPSTPWDALDLLVVLMFFVGTASVAGLVVHQGLRFEPPDRREDAAVESESASTTNDMADKEAESDQGETVEEAVLDQDTAHPILHLVLGGGWTALIVGALSVILVAPLAEEFLFRLLLQGWLQRVLPVPRGLVPIGVSSLVFASLHIRTGSPPADSDYLLATFAMAISNGAIYLSTMLLSVIWIQARHRLTLAQWGIVPDRIGDDIRLGLLALIGTFVPVMALQFLLQLAPLPKGIATDPIPLFVLAAALGLLYYRTGRILPSIVLHLCFNLANLTAALAVAAG
jgi:membrane protease YdiL (CAAX protease family)